MTQVANIATGNRQNTGAWNTEKKGILVKKLCNVIFYEKNQTKDKSIVRRSVIRSSYGNTNNVILST